MKKLGGGSLLLAGIFLAFLGLLIKSDLLSGLLEVLGVIIIIAGAVIGIAGLVMMFTGGDKGTSSDF